MDKTKEDRLKRLYDELAELIPDALAEDFIGRGYAKGEYYDKAETRILIVEKIPRPEGSCCCSHEDEKDFTGVAAHLAQHLLNLPKKGDAQDWQQHVAWTYLYKLAPRRGKPDQTIYGKQKELCGRILKEEIALLKPTHIFFFTGWGGIWDFDFPLSSLLKGEAVEGWGRQEDGAKLIVTRYAVRKPEEKFIHDILEKVQLLESMEKEAESDAEKTSEEKSV